MKFWQVDAFTKEPFGGNPAAVFILEEALSEKLMQEIAMEMNLSETAFVVLGKPLSIRWFTPNEEVNLCGHATLASAHILWEKGFLKESEIVFESRSGPLKVTRNGSRYTLDFPAQEATEIKGVWDEFPPEFVGSNKEDCMVVVSEDSVVKSYIPDFEKICSLEERGFLLTAPDSTGEYDYIYRGFFPKLNVPEDPVTGSANTCLAPYWAKRLGKSRLKAKQVSERGGEIELEVTKDRVRMTGDAVTVIEGEFLVCI